MEVESTRAALINILACPNCEGSLNLSTREICDRSDIVTGELSCDGCKTVFFIKNGIPQLMPKFISNGLESERKNYVKWRHKLNELQKWRESVKKNADRPVTQNLINNIYTHTLDIIRPIDKNDFVLDIGCGKGILKTLMGSNVNYTGIEPLINYQEPYDFPVVQGLGEYLPIKSNTVKEVFVYQTLDHSVSPQRLIQEVRRVLRPDGNLNVQQILLPRPRINFSLNIIKNIKTIRNFMFQNIGLKSKTHFFSAGDLLEVCLKYFDFIQVYKISSNQIFLRAHNISLSNIKQ